MSVRDADGQDLTALLGIGGIEPLLSIGEVAKILGVGHVTVRRWIKSGKINAIRLGDGRGRVMVEPSELRDYMRRCRMTRPGDGLR